MDSHRSAWALKLGCEGSRNACGCASRRKRSAQVTAELVLHSRGDPIISFDQGREVAALIQGADFVPLESRNRIVLDTESAWRQLVDALSDFLPVVSAKRGTSPVLDDLTAREREILQVVAEGLDNHEIAARLDISEKTVRNHVSTIFSKLQLRSRAQAVALARDAGYGRRAR